MVTSQACSQPVQRLDGFCASQPSRRHAPPWTKGSSTTTVGTNQLEKLRQQCVGKARFREENVTTGVSRRFSISVECTSCQHDDRLTRCPCVLPEPSDKFVSVKYAADADPRHDDIRHRGAYQPIVTPVRNEHFEALHAQKFRVHVAIVGRGRNQQDRRFDSAAVLH
jgi:hypothetical protein